MTIPGSLFEGMVNTADEFSGTSSEAPINVPAGFGAVVVVDGGLVVDVAVVGVVVGVVVVVWGGVVVVVVVVTGAVVVVLGGVRTRGERGFGASPII